MNNTFDSPHNMLRRLHYLVVTALACFAIYLFIQVFALPSVTFIQGVIARIIAGVGMLLGIAMAIVSLLYIVMKPVKKG